MHRNPQGCRIKMSETNCNDSMRQRQSGAVQSFCCGSSLLLHGSGVHGLHMGQMVLVAKETAEITKRDC